MTAMVSSSSQKSLTITPYLVVRDAAAAIAFYEQAFGAEETQRMLTPDGSKILHAELRIGNAIIFLSDEFINCSDPSPDTLQGSSVTIHLQVDNVDTWFERAVQAGATILLSPEDMFWGDRYGKLVDPFGHRWSIASAIEPPSLSPLQQPATAVFSI